MESSVVVKALDLNRKLPPSQIPKNIAALSQIIDDEEMEDEIVQRIDQPLGVISDSNKGVDFLKCEYNRDGDCWRSPYCNEYFPQPHGDDMSDAFYPSGSLLEMEQKGNVMIKEYAGLYFANPIANVYFFETTDSGFGACYLIKNDLENEKGVNEGQWHSIHSFTVDENITGKHTYTLVSTVFLKLGLEGATFGSLNVCGTSTKKSEQNHPKTDNTTEHLIRLGKMLEKNEGYLRDELDSVYVGKSKQIINTGRIPDSYKNTKTLLNELKFNE
jgi:capping protein beta